jgi:hypothetical protein
VLTIWVERLLISERVAQKILEKHDLRTRQVRAAVERVEGLEFAWDYDCERGLRAIVYVQIPRLETSGEEAPGEEAPGEEAPGEEAPGEEAPGEEAPGEEAPGEEALVVLYPTDDPADNEWRLGSAYFIDE